MKGRENSLFFGSLSIIISLEGSNKSETCFFIGPKGGVGNYLEPKTTQNPNFWLFNVPNFVLKIKVPSEKYKEVSNTVDGRFKDLSV